MTLLSLANGDGISGVSDRPSTAGRLCVFEKEPELGFFRRLSEALDAVLAFLDTPDSSTSIDGVGLRDDAADTLPLRTLLLLRVRRCSPATAMCRGCCAWW